MSTSTRKDCEMSPYKVPTNTQLVAAISLSHQQQFLFWRQKQRINTIPVVFSCLYFCSQGQDYHIWREKRLAESSCFYFVVKLWLQSATLDANLVAMEMHECACAKYFNISWVVYEIQDGAAHKLGRQVSSVLFCFVFSPSFCAFL